MKRIKDNLDKGELLSTQDLADVNDVAGALKLYVRELPEALCTFKLFSAFCDTLKLADIAVRMDETRVLLQQLPLPNQTLLETLCSMLYIVSRNHVINKMHVSNLALVFGPNVLYSDPATSGNGTDLMRMQLDSANVIGVVSFLIEHCEALFDDAIGKSGTLAFHARLLGHQQRVNLVAQTADLSLVWSIDTENVVRFTSASSLMFEGQLQLPHRVYDVCMLGPHALLATVAGIEVRDAQTGGVLHTLVEPSAAAPQPVSHVVYVDSNVWAVRHAPVSAAGESSLLLDVYDTATWKRFHTIPIPDAPHDASGGVGAVTHLFVAGARIWLCLADGSVRVVDPQSSAVRKETSRGSHIVASASTPMFTWTAHADGTVTVWDHERVVVMRTLRDLGGDGEQVNITKLAAFGATRAFGTVRDCVMVWDLTTGQRVALAQGYANGKNTTIVPVYNTARKRYYAWTGSTDGSVCVWAMPPSGLNMAAPDIAALQLKFPTMRVLSREQRETVAQEQGVDALIVPRILGQSTHATPLNASGTVALPPPLASPHVAAADVVGIAASVAAAARGAQSVTPVLTRRKPSGDSDATMHGTATPVAAPVAASLAASSPAVVAASMTPPDALLATHDATEPLSARSKPSGAAPRPSGVAPAPAPTDSDERKKRAVRRKSLAADKVTDFAASLAEQNQLLQQQQPPPPPLSLDEHDGTAAPPGSPLPPRHRPAPPPLDLATGDTSSPRAPSSSLATAALSAADDDQHDGDSSDAKERKKSSKRTDGLASPRKGSAGSAIKAKSRSSGSGRRTDVDIDINSDDVPQVLKNLAAAQRGEGDEATRAMLQQLTLTGSMPALARHASAAASSPVAAAAAAAPAVEGTSSPKDGSPRSSAKMAKKTAKQVKESKARKSLGSAELAAMLAVAQTDGGGKPAPPRHNTPSGGHAKPKPPPPPLPADVPSATEEKAGDGSSDDNELPVITVQQAAAPAPDDDEMD
jgi:WD40 repeat protein